MRYGHTFLLLSALLVPSLAGAAWQPGGSRIGSGSGFVATESSGRVIVAWAGGNSEIRALALTAEGDLAPGWPSAGAVVASDAAAYNGPVTIAEDGAAGAFVIWAKFQVSTLHAFVQHITATGSVAVGWEPGGLDLGAGGWPVAAYDGESGVLVGFMETVSSRDYRARIHRLHADGTPHESWPIGGYSIPNAFLPGVAVDDQGHVFAGTIDYEITDPPGIMIKGLRVVRMDRNANPDPAWPQGGTLLPEALGVGPMTLFPDGAGGVFTSWRYLAVCIDGGGGYESPCPPPPQFTTRIQRDGVRDAGWNPAISATTMAPDGTGGMLLGLTQSGRPYVSRLDANGKLMPGWKAGGNAAVTELVEAWGPCVAGDGEGGAFVAWTDARTGQLQVYASRLDPEGHLARGWARAGNEVSAPGPANTGASGVQLLHLNAGATLALWTQYTTSGNDGYLTALSPGEPGSVPDLRPVWAQVGFGISQLRPNPSRGPITAMVELQAGPAQIRLIDATGRVLETREVYFWRQAQGAVHFNRDRGLRPGIYWIRVTQGSQQATKKVILIE